MSTAVVHLTVLYEAVCHYCGWSSPLGTLTMADELAEQHSCPEGELEPPC
jgi:hypothetical protein